MSRNAKKRWMPGFCSEHIPQKKWLPECFMSIFKKTKSDCQDFYEHIQQKKWFLVFVLWVMGDECLAWENPWEHSDSSLLVMSDEWSVMGEGWWMMIYKWWVSWEHSRGHSNVHLKYISSLSQIHLNNTSLHQFEIAEMFAPLWQSLMHIKSTCKLIQFP